MEATGFLAAGVHSDQITKSEVERHRYDEMDDMLATTGTAMLGLTIGCARCHDHKFDPILHARLLSDALGLHDHGPQRSRSRRENADQYRRDKEKFDREHEAFVAALRKYETEKLPARSADWEKSPHPANRPTDDGMWLVLEPSSLVSKEKATFTRLDDGSWLASGANGKFDSVHVRRPHRSLGHHRHSHRSAGRSVDGSWRTGPGQQWQFRSDRFPRDGRACRRAFGETGDGAKKGARRRAAKPRRQVHLCNPRATFEQPGLPVRATIDGDPHSGWAIDPQFGHNQAAVYETTSPVGFPGGTVLTFTLQFNGNDQHNIGRLRIAVRRGPPPKELLGPSIAEPVVAAMAVPMENRSPQQTAALLAWFRTTDPDWQKLNRAVQEHAAKAPKPQLTRAFVCSEGLTPLNTGSTQGDAVLQANLFPQPRRRRIKSWRRFARRACKFSTPRRTR